MGTTRLYANFDDLQYTGIPEPSSVTLLACGLLAYAWRKRK